MNFKPVITFFWVFTLGTIYPNAIAQTGEWTWMGGSNTVPSGGGQPGVYGFLGVPAVGNIPGGFHGAASWADSNDNLFLFGGLGFDAAGNSGFLNDLWKFNPSTNEWAWIGGSSSVPQPCQGLCGQSGIYGNLGTAAAGNIPGSRYVAASWKDNSGNFWLFGGEGFDATGNRGELNDLWEFNPTTSQWTWMGGSNMSGQLGAYGTLGTPAAGNVPGSRSHAVSWTDIHGNFWLFGGFNSKGIFKNFNDLWVFTPSTNEWTWMGGSSTSGRLGVYGTLGTPATENVPGNRNSAAGWLDSSGNLWLFGGWGFDAVGNQGELNDLWEFNPSTSQWTWMGGSNKMSCANNYCGESGVYGTLGTAAAGNIPGGRNSSTSWADNSGHLWLFGGYECCNKFEAYLNDLWEFDPSTNQWTWMGGSNTIPYTKNTNGGPPGVYGSLGTPATGNVPGGRYNVASWTDSSSHLWLFGGYGPDSVNKVSLLNDLWQYLPPQATIPAKTTPTVNVTTSPSSITTAQGLAVKVTVSGSGNPTPTGFVTLTGGGYTSVATALNVGSATFDVPAGSLAAGIVTLKVSYLGDGNYNTAAGTTTATVTTAVKPSFTVGGTAVVVTPGATTGNTSAITVTPTGGFRGNVTLTGAVTSTPTGARYPPTLSFGSSSTVNITGDPAGTANLTISTTAATSAALVHPKRPGVPWYAGGGATLACFLFFGIPARRRNWRTIFGMLMFFAALTGGMIACGGGGAGGSGGAGIPGTTAGTYTLTVTGTSGPTTASGTVTFTVR